MNDDTEDCRKIALFSIKHLIFLIKIYQFYNDRQGKKQIILLQV